MGQTQPRNWRLEQDRSPPFTAAVLMAVCLPHPVLAQINPFRGSNAVRYARRIFGAAGDAVHRKELSCRVMNYRIGMPGSGAERTRTLTWCKTKDGWKIA
jgi:hypothetical protein